MPLRYRYLPGRALSTVYLRLNAQCTAGLQRAPLLERLLARADSSMRETDWRAAAFSVVSPAQALPAVAAVAQYADLGRVDRASVFMATPVHYVAAMSSVQLPADGLVELKLNEAQTIAEEFNRLWSDDGVTLMAGQAGALYCAFDQPVRAETTDPQRAAGKDIGGFLPTGTDAARLRRMMSEIEMWLFEHAVNRMRASRNATPVSGLWLWGGGATLKELPQIMGWTAGHDVLFAAFPPCTQYPRAAGSGVVVLEQTPGAEDWPEAESRWLRPMLAALSAGRIEQARLSAGERCFSLSARWRWRFWRHTRAWWESFDDDA
jgi:hypothetical protein